MQENLLSPKVVGCFPGTLRRLVRKRRGALVGQTEALGACLVCPLHGGVGRDGEGQDTSWEQHECGVQGRRRDLSSGERRVQNRSVGWCWVSRCDLLMESYNHQMKILILMSLFTHTHTQICVYLPDMYTHLLSTTLSERPHRKYHSGPGSYYPIALSFLFRKLRFQE